MDWEKWKKLFEAGKIVVETGKKVYEFKNHHDLETYCQQIIDDYELEYNETVEDFRKCFEKIPAHKKTIFYKCYPDIEEYLEQAKKHPGKMFNGV